MKKPTIKELEDILKFKGNHSIQINPDGSITAIEIESIEDLKNKISKLEKESISREKVLKEAQDRIIRLQKSYDKICDKIIEESIE